MRRWVIVAATIGVLASAAGPIAAQPLPAQFRGGPDHLGRVDTRGVERLGGIAWTFQTRGPVRGSPTVAGGVVYVGSSDGHLYALDAVKGDPRWAYDAGAPVGGAPLVTEERVFVTTRGNAVHAVERRTGRRAWTVRTGQDLPLTWGHEGWDSLLPSPVFWEGTVLVGSGDGHLYALDPATGAERWRFRTNGRIRSAPAVANGVAYIGSGDGLVYGVDVASGEERWRFRTAGADLNAADFNFDRTQIQGSPAVADGVLYIGSRDASLYAIDLRTGRTRWTAEDGTAWVVVSPALAGGTVYSGRSSSGQVRAVDAFTGRERWAHRTGGPVFSSPVVVRDTVYVGSGDRRVYALDARSGEVRWSFDTGGMVYGTPAIWDGRLYIGSDDGFVYALRAAEALAPQRAVYWDAGFMARSSVGRQPAHERIAEYFRGFGYEALDATGLEAFLTERMDDRAPSVVVFAMDGVPPAVANRDGAAMSLLRRYLESGGKVVWTGRPPLLVEFDEKNQVAGTDRRAPAALLGVDHQGWNADVYPVAITETGRAWGLRTPFTGSPGVAAGAAGTILALAETGEAAAWAKSYGGPEGTGYVVVPATLDTQRLHEMRQVAEYGVFRQAVSAAR